MSASAQRKLHQARQRLADGDVTTAAALAADVLERAPRNPEALWLLGTARLMQGDARAAVALLERALEVVPDSGSMLENLGLAHLMAGDHAAAERVLRTALKLPGAPASVRMRLGIALLHQGEHRAAIDELERVVAVEPDNADARLGLGRAHAADGRWDAAAREFERVLAREPSHADALYNLAVASLEQRDTARARTCLERVIALAPSSMEPRERLATLHLSLGRYAEAIDELREILRAQPEHGRAWTALANACFESGALEDAESAALRAQELDPSRAGPYGVLARVSYVRGHYDEAARVLEQGHERTGSDALLGTLTHLLHRMCDWPKWQAAWRRLAPRLDGAADCGTPFYLLCEATNAQQQLAYSRSWAAARFPTVAAKPPPASRGAADGRRLRIGYFSPDLHEHATAYLLAEVLELHDRRRFEIFAYSYGPEDHSPMRARLRSAVEHFVDVAWDPDDAVLERMRADALDLLIDLKGYTMGERLRLLAQRPCAVQATWIGYPGTTGAAFFDYLIADPFVVPPEAEAAYSERIVRLPPCYPPNDRKRPRPDPLARQDYGLPEDAFVFCCFNQTVKITPEVWARWMKLLQAVPHSVLWLLEDNRWASEHLGAAMRDAGLDPARLVIAPRLPLAEHLARYGAADLALDTLPYTSHTTGSDALWMGCPLVALCGDTFASRVSGSLLASCGMADLIAYSLEEYEALACRLAADRSYMQNVRERLAAARENAPLFDSERFTHELEALYLRMVDESGID